MMRRMRLADYVARFFADHGFLHVFMVTGGGAMHLNDAFGREKRLRYICCHHEQACAMAAESYARLSGKPAIVNVTTGPGGINALNGVFGAWTDSIPMVVISGQVKRETCMAFNDVPGLRQLGDQEADIVSMAKGITKYAVVLREAESIRFHLEKALHLATTGRPGPCWVDIPVDLQGAAIDTESLRGYTPELPGLQQGEILKSLGAAVFQKAQEAKRPVIIAGGGIRAAGVYDQFLKLLDHWQVPIAPAWNAYDLVWNDHPLFAGRPGSLGDRAGNFAVQNSDFLLVLGSRLNVRQVSYNWKSFARSAYKVMVDVDEAELRKPTVKPDLAIHADAGGFINTLLELPPVAATPARGAWIQKCREWRRQYPAVMAEYWNTSEGVNPYCFVESLFSQLQKGAVVVCGDGTACVTTFQAASIKRGQRVYTNSGCASMGYDLPGAIGACIASGGAPVVCLAGDGSIQMNLQELQTIVTHQLPVKIFVLNNRGYHSIRQTQQNFFPDNIVGCGGESGLGFPDFEKLAVAFDISYFKAHHHGDLNVAIKNTLKNQNASLCEIFLDLRQQFAPKTSSRRLPDGSIVSPPLEDLAPFLDRDELKKNMFI